MGSRSWRMVAIAVLALGAACSSTDGGARATRTKGRVVWVDFDGHWVSRPQAVGSVFVAYLERDGQLSLVGIDPGSGRRVWELPASAGSLTPGVVIGLAQDDRNVYFGTPVDVGGTGSDVFVVAVDAASGTEVWRTSQELHVNGLISTCADDATMLCTTALGGRTGSSLRIAKSTGEVTTLPLPRGALPPQFSGGRKIGNDLYDLGGRDPEWIARVDSAGRILWTKTAGELFQGRPVSSDYGWDWRTHGDLLVGWLGRIDTNRSSTDLSESTITAVDAATGDAVWIVDGVIPDCDLSYLDLSPGPAPLRCRRSGTITRDENRENPIVTGLSIVLEQFDPTTGATLWEADLGAAESLVLDTPPLVRLSSTEIVVGRQDGSDIVVDVASGQTRQPAPDETGWCWSENTYPDVRTYAVDKRRRGYDYVTPCGLDRSPIDVVAPNPPFAVARSGPILAWVDARGMHGADSG